MLSFTSYHNHIPIGQIAMLGTSPPRAYCKDGLGVKVSGYVERGEGDRVCDIRTNDLGMGSFVLDASPNDKYTAVLTTEDGNTKRVDLPAFVSDSGYAIQLVANGENIVYNVLTAGNADLSDKFIFINSRGMPLGVYPVELTMGKSMNFATAPEGILNFTLLDGNGVVYSNRMWYHYKPKHENFKFNDGDNVDPRKERKVSLSINNVESADLR